MPRLSEPSIEDLNIIPGVGIVSEDEIPLFPVENDDPKTPIELSDSDDEFDNVASIPEL